MRLPHLRRIRARKQLGETSMEFTLPPGELDRIFVETKKRGVRPRMPRGMCRNPTSPRNPKRLRCSTPRLRTLPVPIARRAAESRARPTAAETRPQRRAASRCRRMFGLKCFRGSSHRPMPKRIEAVSNSRSDRSGVPHSPFDSGPQESARSFIPWLARRDCRRCAAASLRSFTKIANGSRHTRRWAVPCARCTPRWAPRWHRPRIFPPISSGNGA